jgi:MHS family proline/betaine transporter-like MFS transporter
VQAFSCGGEIGVSVAYLMEFSPAGRRGRYGGWYLSTVGVGIAAGLGATAFVAAIVDSAALQSWGWRLPFLLALPLGLVGLYIRRRLTESPVFAGPALPGRVEPLAVLREFGPTVRRCFVLACAYSAAFNVWFLFLPSYVTATGSNSLSVALTCALTGLLVTAVTAPVFGRLSDRLGWRPVLLGATASLAVVAVPVYLWMLTGSTLALMLGSVVMGVIIGAFVIPAFFAEQFPARVRATGLGLAYGVGSAVVGGTAPVLATVLSRQASPAMVPGYLMIWALFALIAVLRSPESHSAAAT